MCVYLVSPNDHSFGTAVITPRWLFVLAAAKMFTPHPLMSSDEIREGTQKVWDRLYELGAIWKRSACTSFLRARLAFVLLSYCSPLKLSFPFSIAVVCSGSNCSRTARRCGDRMIREDNPLPDPLGNNAQMTNA
jgi:hypothetical protein